MMTDTLALFRAAEAHLPALHDPDLKRLPPRQRWLFTAIAALDRGERSGVLTLAADALRAGEHDIARLLELIATPPATQVEVEDKLVPSAAYPGTGSSPFLLHALAAWRRGRSPRGTTPLRRLADERPILRGLLDVFARRTQLSQDPKVLMHLHPRAGAVYLAAFLHLKAETSKVPELLAKQLGDHPLDLTRYTGPQHPLAGIPALRRWLDDPHLEWGREQSAALMGARAQAPLLLSVLLRAIHRRLAAGLALGVLPALRPCRRFAEQAHALPALLQHLEALEVRLGGLLVPTEYLPPLLTLWRRCLGRPPAERSALAKVIATVLATLIDTGRATPSLLVHSSEALVYRLLHTDDLNDKLPLIDYFGPLLPAAAVQEALQAADPLTRRHALGAHALSCHQIGQTLDAVRDLALNPAGASYATSLLFGVFEFLATGLATRADRHRVDQALVSLRTTPSHLEARLLPILLQACDDLALDLRASHALVRQRLALPLPESDPEIGEHLLALHLLGAHTEADELVRKIGRWLRRAPPDAADELTLRVLARLFDELDALDDPDRLRRLAAPLGAFLLREGPARPLRAATQLGALASPYAAGYGAWAHEFRTQLGPHPLWHSLITRWLAERDEDDDPYNAPPRSPSAELPF